MTGVRWPALLGLLACSTPTPSPAPAAAPAAPHADAVAATATGTPGAYTFAVTVRSPDTGCAQYADWWEVLDASGALLYRRILNHSHPGEQPFTRDGGPVPASADQELWIRVHNHPGGYGGQALTGSVSGGFKPVTPPEGFASAVETQAPLPEKCLF